MAEILVSTRRSRWRLVGLLVFVNLSVLALVAASLYASYERFQDQAAATSRNTNRLVAQSIAGDIDQVHLVLDSVADEVVRQTSTGHLDIPEISAFLTRQEHRLAMTDSLRISDKDGLVVAGSGSIPPDIRIEDRDYFQAVRDDSGGNLFISAPTKGRISGKWVLIFASRISLPDGSFGGVAFAPVTIEWFETKFNNLEVGKQGTVVMRGDASRNFDLLARFPHAGYVGQTKVSDTFRARIAANPEGGTYQAVAGADSIRRTFSYRPIAGYPLITLVGIATDDTYAAWRMDAMKAVGLAAAFILVTTLGGVSMLRAWVSLERRTADLARSNADLEQFAYVASHDLQTPLRNIASYSQLLERRYKGRLDDDADEFIGYVVDSAKHLAQMIPDLLDYSRVSTAPRELVPVDLNQTLATVLEKLAPTIREAGADVQVAPLPTILGEPVQAESLFQNLVENALVYRHPDRQPRISVSAAADGPRKWRIAVEDNGIGIEDVYHDKVFVIFQRLNPETYPGGTGIGLALCRRIALRFGGNIRLESCLGQGSRFIVALTAPR